MIWCGRNATEGESYEIFFLFLFYLFIYVFFRTINIEIVCDYFIFV